MGEAGLRREERELLQRQSADMQRQLDAIDAQMQRAELQEAERRQLQRVAAALRAQQRSAQLQLDQDGGAGAAAPLPTCPASCTAGYTPPSSNGCGNALTGKFHGWAMTMMQARAADAAWPRPCSCPGRRRLHLLRLCPHLLHLRNSTSSSVSTAAVPLLL